MSRSAYLWCPGYPLADAAHRQRTVAAARALTEAAGCVLVESPLLARHLAPGAWLPVSERVADLRHGLECDLLIAGRGGYGCLDLIDPLLAETRTHRPTLIGYSDLTVLHALWQRRGWGESLYGFMPGVAPGARALASTRIFLAGEGLALGRTDAPTALVLHPGTARGPLFPACLRVLTGLVGTPVMPELTGAILAVEDLDERPYRLDRDFHQLTRSGSLESVVGLVCGTFPAENPPDYAGPAAADICRRWAERLGVPALFGLPFGHVPDPLTLPRGRAATLDCHGDDWRLTIEPR
jgi:muramoyltetrapeptide carboxypeptidase